MVQKFWWGQTNEKTKMVWLSWGKVCTPKKEGGLGFLDNFSQTRVEASNKYIISGLQSFKGKVFSRE